MLKRRTFLKSIGMLPMVPFPYDSLDQNEFGTN